MGKEHVNIVRQNNINIIELTKLYVVVFQNGLVLLQNSIN